MELEQIHQVLSPIQIEATRALFDIWSEEFTATSNAKEHQTIFTKVELAERWECCTTQVGKILKYSNIKPIGKRGRAHEFNLEDIQAAKEQYDSEFLKKHAINWKMRNMA
ncbi:MULTISPECIES: hypothetical protein [unclassified Enterococcus]|uniref:hypothetical protein n=1 Tax=unclassified Enterococcus TaxID=2608891 RepID=UPI001551D482|nr:MULTISPECIES: hypothetical protein [unclassified Enterococcus]MBS7578471.1 hypothetical protein [Enterococcus sp. MMGLQ5-2]MBS7585704.1 hypothetical protein [Enterococcus sp. MMGLQ5-1]NPD13563.1 hypothetical protein [Enterococcus sp. MMGLQ5-1]NPD38305.1 hypothetical protein [Enterococcus sp. MMGLQ5-2]